MTGIVTEADLWLPAFRRFDPGSQGQVWPAKEAEPLKTALKEVERAMPKYQPAADKLKRAATSAGNIIR